MKKIIYCLSFTFMALAVQAQNDTSSITIDTLLQPMVIKVNSLPAGESPYRISWKVDGPLIGLGIGLTGVGVKLISEKPDLTPAELAAKTPDKVPFFDRHSAGWFDKNADDISYPPFQASFALPVVMGLLDKRQRQNFGHVMVMYLETMAITGAMFTMTAGTIHRPRPFVYGTEVYDYGYDESYRRSGNNQRSFYAGHTAATAAATFYAAKVFHDFHPDSKARTFVWIGAAAVPAFVGYMRHKAGMHFLSDNLLGYAIGAATGILVPHFHKKKLPNLSVSPRAGFGYQGISLVYNIK